MATLKQQKTRQEIILAMKDLMTKKAFESITIKLICETAMVHHSTFYRYFSDKYDLLKAVLASLCDDIENRLMAGQTIGEASLAVIKREQVLFEHLGEYQQNSGFYYDFLNGMSSLIFEYAQKQERREQDALLNLVGRSDNLELASYTAAGAMIGLIVKWSNQVSEDSIATLQSFMEETYSFLAQILTPMA